MQTKLTLRLDERLIKEAKVEALSRGTSLSQMVADYFRGLLSRDTPPKGLPPKGLPPVTASLVGVLKVGKLDRSHYRRHLEEKYR
jgi:hypothetical protein